MEQFRGTTIVAVKKDGKTVIAGDGQVTMGQQVILKGTAHKVRRLFDGKVVVGFAGGTADAFAMCEEFEKMLNKYSGSLMRSAVEYAKKVIKNSDERGWLSNYRYKVFSLESGTGVVFIDGSMNRSALMQSTTIAGCVLLGCAALVLILIFLLSKKAVKPIAESYEKQRQFITDANHELKTPLTLIRANAEIAEAELGKNEWLEDIKAEGHRMTELVNQLVALSRMDEENSKLNIVQIPFGELVFDTVSEFEALARGRGKALSVNIDRSIIYSGDETLLHRLVGILLDNAVKYCDEGGEIKVNLEKRRRIILSVENTYAAIGEIELNKLFDRFYRADKARKFTGGYGVGLSMAKAIAEKHKGEITAYKKDKSNIGFKVVL